MRSTQRVFAKPPPSSRRFRLVQIGSHAEEWVCRPNACAGLVQIERHAEEWVCEEEAES